MSLWQPIETAPKKAGVIRARGFNFGDPSKGRHCVLARWWPQYGWVAAFDRFPHLATLGYISEWRPLPRWIAALSPPASQSEG